MSEASNEAPPARPRMRGVLRRAATRSSGSSAETTAMEKEPRTTRSAARTASARPMPSAEVLLDEVGEHLGVGGRVHDVSGPLELDLQLGVVLDDPVVDHRHPAGAVEERVGVLDRGVAVGGPAGVADPGRGAGRGVVDQLLQLGHRAGAVGGPGPPERPGGGHHDPGRVVPAVLQAFQALDQQVDDPVEAGGPDDPAHGLRG